MAIKAEKYIAWDQGKRQKRGEIGNISASGGLSLPKLPLGSLRSPIFFAHPDFPFFPQYGAWFQARKSTRLQFMLRAP